jgi:hypothetical protein
VFNHSKSPHKPLRFHRFTYGHCHFCKQLQLSPLPFVLLNITLLDIIISSSQSNEKSCREVGLSALAKLDAEHVKLKALLNNNHKECSKILGHIAPIEHLSNDIFATIFKFAATLPYARINELPSSFVASQVNSRWRMAAARNPNTWTELCLFPRTPVPVIQQCLSRTKDYFLDVVVYISPIHCHLRSQPPQSLRSHRCCELLLAMPCDSCIQHSYFAPCRSAPCGCCGTKSQSISIISILHASRAPTCITG